MSSSYWIRWGALAFVLGGALFIVVDLLYMTLPESVLLQDVGQTVGIAFILVGMVGLHTLQKGAYGLIGRVGFYIVVVGVLTQLLEAVFFISAGSALEWVGLVGYMIVIVGFWVFGAATLRAGILPWWCGVGLIVAIVLPLVLNPGGAALQGLFWVALGYVLWSRRTEPAEQPSRVS